MLRRHATPLGIFVGCALIYLAVMGERALTPSPDNHFVHLANSWLHGQLSVLGDKPPGNNDWALYQGRWYVSFPPFPAVLLLPWVALFGLAVKDRLLWALCAAMAPTLVFCVLRTLRERGESERSARDDLLLSLLYGLGTVYFFVAVQGSVWFAAHVVATLLLWLYAWASLDARYPLLAGTLLGCAFLTRPTTAFAALFFAVETMRTRRRPDDTPCPSESPLRGLGHWLKGVDWPATVRRGLVFAAPVLALGALAMWHNHARFDDPFAFGHQYLQVRWRTRIERWGLFNYHYFPKNLAIVLASLPWLSAAAPHVRISAHGLALWFTTPNLLWTLYPRRRDARLVCLYAIVLLVGLLNLSYQNSGWIQFGYRFSLDYMPWLLLALALGGRRFGWGFRLLAVLAVLINLFGALTFDRARQYYDVSPNHSRLFQPD